MTRYPHIATLTTHAAATQNSSGDWVEGAASVSTTDCREEPNSAGSTIQGQDGKAVIYSSIVYFPILSIITIVAGMGISVQSASGTVRLTGIIQRVSIDSKHIRVWV